MAITFPISPLTKKVKAEVFVKNVRVDDTGDADNGQGTPDIAVDKLGVIHVVWADWRNDADGDNT